MGNVGIGAGLTLSVCVFALAAYFAYRQWVERRDRADDLSEDDARYFGGKDARRFGNSVIMSILSVGMVAGTLINPRDGDWQRRSWAGIWAAILLLVFALVLVALVDAIATFRYGLRQRQALADERLVLEYEFRRRMGKRTGDADNDRA
jgi:hypothetical protein